MNDAVPVRVGWLSGVSRIGTRALSPEQRALVRTLPAPSGAKLWTNFPYDLDADETAPERGFRETSLFVASAVNTCREILA